MKCCISSFCSRSPCARFKKPRNQQESELNAARELNSAIEYPQKKGTHIHARQTCATPCGVTQCLMTIAALYIDPRGPYPRMAANIARDAAAFPRMPRTYGMPDALDCWDATRDARLYAGPHPVVAHPPCKHWGRLRHLAHVECRACSFNGPDRGAALVDGPPRCPVCGSIAGYVSDRDCAPRAVEQVRAYGGVLEHPAGSLLWEACGLPRVGGPCSCNRVDCLFVDEWGGYTIELDQVEWGHVARKRTWLYLVGVPREALEASPFPRREPTHRVARDRRMTDPARGRKECSAAQRRRTPPLFAEYLVRLAQAAKKR